VALTSRCDTYAHIKMDISQIELTFIYASAMGPLWEGSMIGNSTLGASALILFIAQSQAATLEFQGDASVDNGSGFSPALHYMLLNGGDRVRALKGCAKIIYDNGYCTKVCEGQMAVVFSTPPEHVGSCTPRNVPVASSTEPEYVADGSLTDTPAASPKSPAYAGNGSLKDTPAVISSPQAPNSDLLPAGMLLAAGGGVAFAIATTGNDSRPASP
jgi:hypothetical protein